MHFCKVSGDKAEKILGHQFLAKSKTIAAGGLGAPGGPG